MIFVLPSQEEAVGPLPMKKPRGRPKGSKKVTTVSGQTVGVNGLYSFMGKREAGCPFLKLC